MVRPRCPNQAFTRTAKFCTLRTTQGPLQCSIRGVWGGSRTPIRREGHPIRKKNVSLGVHVLSFCECKYPSTVATVAACGATLVRLC